MKFFSSIMAIIVLALSCMPCTDADAFYQKESKQKVITKSLSQSNTDHTDACSPFCSCNCCAGFSINHTITSFSSLRLHLSNSYSSFLPSDLIRVSLPIWQPPQL